MKYIPVCSKQIAYVRYDDQSSQIQIQYHTGYIQTCVGIDESQILKLIESDNPYDMVMKLTEIELLKAKTTVISY